MNESVPENASAEEHRAASRFSFWLAIPLVLFATLTLFLFAGIGKDPSKLPSVLIGRPAPEFMLETLRDPQTMISKADLGGRTVLLNVWASWCFACRIEHETVSALAESGNVPVYGLNWKDERSDALRWLSQFGDPYTASAHDPGGRTGIDFGVYGAPETFLIDPQGCVRYKHVGPIDEQIVNEEILPLVAELDAGADNPAEHCG